MEVRGDGCRKKNVVKKGGATDTSVVVRLFPRQERNAIAEKSVLRMVVLRNLRRFSNQDTGVAFWPVLISYHSSRHCSQKET